MRKIERKCKLTVVEGPGVSVEVDPTEATETDATDATDCVDKAERAGDYENEIV